MPTDDELEQLEQWILGLQYPYHGGGWLKALRLASFRSLAPRSRGSADDPGAKALRAGLETFMAGAADSPELRRRIVAAFLWDELTDHTPEHAMWSDLVGSDWRPAEVQVAREVVEQIVAVTAGNLAQERQERAAEAAEWSTEESAAHADDADADDADEVVNYDELRATFFERLFDPASVGYFVQRPTTPAGGAADPLAAITMRLEAESMAGPDRFGTASPRLPAVIGLDRRIIAVFWLN